MPERDLAGCRVLVTGGAGFIGSHVCEALLAAGAGVVAADNLSTGSHANLCAARGAELVETSLDGDLELLRGTDLLIHIAGQAYVPPSVEDPIKDFEVNLHLTLRLLEWCRRNSPSTRIVLFSSAAVYGNPKHVPVSEEAPLDPISPYGVANLASERYGAVYARLYGMPVASMRCFAVYGPRQRKQVVYDLMQRMHEGNGELRVIGGDQVRDFCFVEDVARATLLIARRAPLQGEAWNVGGGHGYTIRELVAAIGEALELEARPVFTGKNRPGDPDALVSDCGRLERLGWKQEVPFAEGLRRTAAWFLATTTKEPA